MNENFKTVIIECGASLKIPTLRVLSEKLREIPNTFLLRIHEEDAF